MSNGPWCTHLLVIQVFEAFLDWFPFLSFIYSDLFATNFLINEPRFLPYSRWRMYVCVYIYISPGKWCLIGMTCLAMRCQHAVHSTAGVELAGIFQTRTQTSMPRSGHVCVPTLGPPPAINNSFYFESKFIKRQLIAGENKALMRSCVLYGIASFLNPHQK